KWNGAAWACAVDVDTDTNTQLSEAEVDAYVANNGYSMGAHTIDTDTLAALGCGAGESPVWNTALGIWECGTDADLLAGLSCPGDDVLRWSTALSQWECQPDTDTVLTEAEVDAYVANNGYSMGAHTIDTDTLATLGCAAGEVAKWDGAAWACAVDVDTDTNTDVLASLPCGNNQIVKWNGALGNWQCAADSDTTYSGGTGITLTGTSFSLSTAYTDTRYVQEGQANSVTTAMIVDGTISGADIATGAVTSVDIADNTITAADLAANSVTASEIATAAVGSAEILDGSITSADIGIGAVTGAEIANATITNVDISAVAAIDPAKISGTAWTGTNDGATSGLDADLLDGQHGSYYRNWNNLTNVPAGLADGTDADTLGGLSCTGNQVAKYDFGTSSWICANDIDTDTDTTYSNGTGLSLTGTTFSLNTTYTDGRYVNAGEADSVSASMIIDGTITNADISAGASIEPSKITGTAWTALTDGAGSTLDADLLDGQQGGYYLDWGNLTSLPPGFDDDVDDDVLGGLICANNQVAKFSAGTATWGCANDIDTVNTYVEGTGIDIIGTTVHLETTYTDGRYWSRGGNGGTTPGTDFLGTSDLKEFEIHAGGVRVMRYGYGANPNLIGGDATNSVTAGAVAATVGGGSDSQLVTDSYGTLGGGRANQAGDGAGTAGDASYATVSGGGYNIAGASYSTIGGGLYNVTSASYATIGGGGGSSAATGNSVTDMYGTIGGGYDNQAGDAAGTTNDASNATVGGGRQNVASAGNATVAGGYGNTASAQNSFIGAGNTNLASGTFTVVGGGRENQATAAFAGALGGTYNTATAMGASVGGGGYNAASGQWSVIAGGGGSLATQANLATDNYCTVAGGSTNQAGDNAGVISDRLYATVGGGFENTASGSESTISGGRTNEATATGAFVGGGRLNNADGNYSAVPGGYSNFATGTNAAVGGGQGNFASGTSSVIPGGYQNQASGAYSTAMGRSANADFDGCFAFGDNSGVSTACGAANRFVARASGGTIFYSSTGAGAGVVLMPGSSSWLAVSDRNQKENFEEVDGREVLEKLAAMPMSSWNYKAQDARVRHMGPMAQDFFEAYGLGPDERHIATVDADGVALAAIQGLNQKLEEQEARHLEEVRSLEERIARLERLLVRR
ncbi:MAG: tail fiber domain-containing protein, partial [Deltaproteobacteria bacterium]|nr:tail fiber domain-containing protein [Deltaproteobacteria bacterium]